MVSTTANAGGGINIESIKANALKDLLDVVDSVRGKKALVLDPSLTGPLGLVVKFSLLRDHGIDKVFHLEPSPLAVPQDKIIYLCRPQQRNAQMILGTRTPIADSYLPPQNKFATNRPMTLCPRGNPTSTLSPEKQLRALRSLRMVVCSAT
jgi:hypothetical protein